MLTPLILRIFSLETDMKTHDYSSPSWGHDYNVHSIEDEGLLISLSGWGKGISNNDYIIIKNGAGTTRYQINSIEYKYDPSDMWFASPSFAPRE